MIQELEIALRLHSCDKTNFAPNLVNGHLEKKNLLTSYLAWEKTFVDEIVTILRLQLKDIVIVTSIQTMLKQSNKVAYIQRTQNNEFVLNFFKLMALKNLTTIITIVNEQMLGKEGFIGTQKNDKYCGIECLVDLLLYQLFTLIHILSPPTIYNKVKMQTKVNHSS
jgi:predicted ATP-dependent serine protease